MDFGSLLAECRRKQMVSGRASIGVYIELTGRRIDNLGQTVQLLGKMGGPRGELVNVNGAGNPVGLFPADKIIAYIQKMVQEMVTENPEAAWKALIDTAEEAGRLQAEEQERQMPGIKEWREKRGDANV